MKLKSTIILFQNLIYSLSFLENLGIELLFKNKILKRKIIST
jgi:hypothetical protein